MKLTPTPARRKLSSLKPHWRQAELFSDLDKPELEALADDLRRNGLLHPIEISPSGTIITGHQRVRAAKLLGWKDIDVIIRYDLALQGPEAVERRLIEDNFHRRHLDRLSRARCIKELRMLWTPDQASGDRKPTPNLRDAIGTLLGITGRSVNRYESILRMPSAVQQAFSRGQLTFHDIGRIARLDPKIRQQIAKRIKAGEIPRQVVAEISSAVNRKEILRPHNYFKKLRQFVRSLPDQVDGISIPRPSDENLGLIEQVICVLTQFRRREKKAIKTPPDPEIITLLRGDPEVVKKSRPPLRRRSR